MSAWLVRQEGSPSAVSVPSEAEVLVGLRNGNWLPTDEVKGPADAEWHSIESHPTFAEAAAEIEPPRAEPKDETHLDMNPLIDVASCSDFLRTPITYASLEQRSSPTTQSSQRDRRTSSGRTSRIVFLVTAKMDGDKSVIARKEVPLEQIAGEMKRVTNRPPKGIS